MWQANSFSAARRSIFILFLVWHDAPEEQMVPARCNVKRPTGICARIPAIDEWGYLEVPRIRGVLRDVPARDRIAQAERLCSLVDTELDKQCVEDVATHPLCCEGVPSDMVTATDSDRADAPHLETLFARTSKKSPMLFQNSQWGETAWSFYLAAERRSRSWAPPHTQRQLGL